MSIATPARRRPGPRPTIPEVAPEERGFLEWLRSLRVLTPFQAHCLVRHFHAVNEDTGKPRTERNTRMRLQRLAKEGFIKSALTHPEKGGYSGIYYRLGGKGLRVLGIPEEKNLLRRPVEPVLRYLLLRNEVYARARQDGWYVLSPLFFPKEKHAGFLKHIESFVTQQLRRLAGRGDKEAEYKLSRLKTYLPDRFTFDCLLKVDAATNRPSALVLVVVDDVRRAIVAQKRTKPTLKPAKERCEKCGGPMLKIVSPDRAYLRCTALGPCRNEVRLEDPSPPQLKDLPYLLTGASLLLRDTQSVYDVQAGKLIKPSPRLRKWRRELAERFGKEFLATDVLFPDVWAQRTNVPPAARPGDSEAEDEGT